MINLDYKFADKYTGTSFKLNIDVTNPDTGAVTDPSSVTVSLSDPNDDLEIDDLAATRDAEGDYHYIITVPSIEGAYRGQSKCVSGAGKITIKTFGFWAEASL